MASSRYFWASFSASQINMLIASTDHGWWTKGRDTTSEWRTHQKIILSSHHSAISSSNARGFKFAQVKHLHSSVWHKQFEKCVVRVSSGASCSDLTLKNTNPEVWEKSWQPVISCDTCCTALLRSIPSVMTWTYVPCYPCSFSPAKICPSGHSPLFPSWPQCVLRFRQCPTPSAIHFNLPTHWKTPKRSKTSYKNM